MKKLSIFLTIMLASNSFVMAQAQQRVKCGWGASVTASTTPAYIAIEQVPGTNIILNGTFANTNSWNTNDTVWVISNGTAVAKSSDNSTGTLSQSSITALTSGVWYRVTYTLSGLQGTNSIIPILGSTSGQTDRTASGTYFDDLSFRGDQTLSFVNTQGGASTAILDNVTLTLKPDPAYVYGATLGVVGTSVPVYVGVNCDGDTFTNMYSAGRTMIVVSNRATEIEQGTVPQMAPIRGFWYQSASGTPTLTINGF
jgi:hypothetical protein